MSEEFLCARSRAEDILLGSLGFGEEAQIVFIEVTPQGYRGSGRYADGEAFDFESDQELGELENWALSVLVEKKNA